MVPDKTQAAVLFETGKPLRILELVIPPIGAGQILVDLAYSGVCHSQLNEVRGHKGPDRYLPHTLGHEGSGTVVAVGEGVTKTKPGDRVVLSWLKGSGTDAISTVYDSADGPINSGAISTFMRRTVTCENRVTVVPESMPFKLAALLGCAIPTGAGVVFNTSGITRGESIAVFGVGGIGQSAVMAAASVGAAPIIAVDIEPAKLAKARELGSTHIIDASEGDPVGIIRQITHGNGVRVAIESAGRVEVMEAAYESVATGGGLCIIAGNPPHGETMRVNPFSLISGKRLVGTWGGESRPDVDIPRYVDMFMNGSLALQKLTTEEYSLNEINQALDDLESGCVIRAMIRM
ncbi:MAG: zinc-binding dehydrogenase [Gammaproteobacteria bacterium]|nr:zinc-binding dehydrogenase [Gammaproteobacteria bacterium]